VPTFWLGLVALYFFYAKLQIVGGPGRLGDAYEYSLDVSSGFVLVDAWRVGLPGAMASAVSHLVLPVLALAASVMGTVARLTRSLVVGELGREYVVLARAKGCSGHRILWRHVLPNIAGPLVTVLALAYARLLEGAVLTETVFAWPGLGRYLSTAVFAGDTPAILGGTLVIGLAFAILNRVADLTARTLDPRFR
jgi:peptide/nickel transport system permease protein